MQGKPRTRHSRAFTLIELMVVVSIIAILVALLIPQLKQARDIAYKGVCASRLRGIGGAAACYANDFDNTLLPTYLNNNGTFWPFYLVGGGYLPQARNPAPVGPPYDLSYLLICPATPDQTAFSSVGGPCIDGVLVSYSPISYGINGVSACPITGGDWPAPSLGLISGTLCRTRKVNDIKRPSEMALIFDGQSHSITNNIQRIAGRHGNPGTPSTRSGITNILFVDGHVTSVPRAELPQSGSDLSPGNGGINKYPSAVWRTDQ